MYEIRFSKLAFRGSIRMSDAATWESYYEDVYGRASIRRKLTKIYKGYLIGKLVAKYCDRFFSPAGCFLEVGSGVAESSLLIPKLRRHFIALDISALPLSKIENRNVDSKIESDARIVPFRDRSLDGIYNVGVMEHFVPTEIKRILAEFKRMLKDEGVIVLFWPWKYCWTEIVSKIRPLFPRTPSILDSFDLGSILRRVGLRLVSTKLSAQDLFLHKVVILRKIHK
jgi:SAM-dependent methyltransferase